jgi:hypothetical protein
MASASLLLSSSQTTPLVIAQGGTNGSRIYSISVALNSTAATLQLNLSGSFGSARISTLSVTAQSGFTAGTAIFDYFGNTVAAGIFQKQKDANGVPYFNLAPNTFLTANTTGSFLASGTTASIFVNGEFY